jgi:hypothetical protein
MANLRKNSATAQYTFFSAVHGTFSKNRPYLRALSRFQQI